jgi:ATP-dependent RNA helicase DDX49/DBP8
MYFRASTVEELEQFYILMPADVKDAYLVHTLDKYLEKNKKSSVIIFTNTCK